MLPVDLQHSIEMQYSKKHVRDLIQQNCTELDYSPCITQIRNWIAEDHYPSKKESLLYLDENVDWVDVLSGILAVVIPVESQEITSVVGQTAHLLPLPYEVAIKRIAEIIYQMAVADLLDITPANRHGTITVSTPYSLSDDILFKLEKARFLPPMVIPPRPIKSRKDSGYLTVRSPVLSKSYNQHDGDLAWDVLNLTNSCAFTLDIDFLKAAKDELEDEQLNQLTNETCVDLYHWGNEFYFNNFYDARGRMYCRGYHLNFQGNSYRKAMLNFLKSEPITVDEQYEGIF